MRHSSRKKQSTGFSRWLRTGRLPRVRNSDGIELKFNPWHDPLNGRFTFAGAGHAYGANDTTHDSGPGERTPKIEHGTTRALRTTATKTGTQSEKSARKPFHQPNPVHEFIDGVGEELYKIAEDGVKGTYSALTTNPLTTVRNATDGIASMIDKVVAAEDTPARIHLSRATEAAINASARDLGRATGSVMGNLALTVAPGAAVSNVSTLRHLHTLRPRTVYNAPEITVVKENLGKDSPAKRYNDAAPGARPGRAPALMRTMPDGSIRPVKFDGVESDYMIDRKMKVVDAPRARAQLLRQSDVLDQHRLLATWELPTAKQVLKARNLFKKMNVANIKARKVEP